MYQNNKVSLNFVARDGDGRPTRLSIPLDGGETIEMDIGSRVIAEAEFDGYGTTIVALTSLQPQ
jgi:hypothetical protein